MGLYETAAFIRRLISLGILGLATLIVLIFSFRAIRRVWWIFFPPPTPPPTVGFGELPTLRLPSLAYKGKPVYVLETATGELPPLPDDFPSGAKVVALKEIQPSPIGEQRAKNLAEKLDFPSEGKLSKDKRSIIFEDVVDKRTLTVNLTNQNFTLTTDLNHIQRIIPKGRALLKGEAIKEAQNFLNRNGLLKGDFDGGRQETRFHRVVGGKVSDALSVSEGQFTRVDFFRNLIGVSAEGASLLPPNPKIGLVQIWITSGIHPTINNILYISYAVWEIDKEKVETYPLRPVSSAWEEVKQGKGVAELLVEGSSPLDPYTPLSLGTVSIRNIDLAYFDDSSWQRYLQPIYAFSGTGKTVNGKKIEFTAYRPAITDNWIREK